jgi:putative addiction module component
MNDISISDILELPVQERIRLVELIWDSVAAVPEAVEVLPELKAKLELLAGVRSQSGSWLFLGSGEIMP